VRSFVKAYQEGEVQTLQTVRVGGSTSDWDAYNSSLREEFAQCPARSFMEAGQRLHALTGLQKNSEYNLHWARLQYRKVSPIRAKAIPTVQATVLTEPPEPILAKPQAGLRP
jgi:hypothetical protein